MVWIALLMAAIAPISPQFAEKMRVTTWRPGCPAPLEDLRQVTVKYWNFEKKPVSGTLIVHKDIAHEVDAIFRDLYRSGFQIERISPVEEFKGDDDASMAANNTSAFNCRDVTGKPGTFSNHSWGRAIDINPLTNPYVKGDKISPPEGRKYLDRTQDLPGLIRSNSFIVKRFREAGWTWGGNWSDPKDYQHFEKPEHK
jgi:hypothetical protein